MRSFSCSDDFIAAAQLDHPACLVLDLDCEHHHGGELQRWLLDQEIELPVILTATSTRSDDAIQGLRLGAIALLRKPVCCEVLGKYVVYATGRRRTQIQWEQRRERLKEAFTALTERQQRVLHYATQGMLNQAIALKLKVSKRTVEAERSKVLKAFESDSFYDVSMRMGEFAVLDELQQLRKQDALLRMRVASSAAEHAIGDGC
jgi:FixJ family two-component response regulator